MAVHRATPRQRLVTVATEQLTRDAFLNDVLTGLAQPQKAIPARWLYDHRGSWLFEAITLLPEYYLTRAEIELLKASATDIAAVRSEERRVGKECVSACRARWSPYH